MFSRLTHLAAAIGLLFSLSVPASVGAANAANVQVMVDKLNVRSGPGLDHAVISSVTAEMKLPVLAEQENWFQVQLPDGQTGWVAGSFVQPLAGGASQIESSVTNLNVRSGPGQSHAVVSQINPGQAYPVVAQNGQWFQIQLPDGQTGWVAGWLVKETASAAAQQAEQADSVQPAQIPAQPAAGVQTLPVPGQPSPATAAVSADSTGPQPAAPLPTSVTITLAALTNVHNDDDPQAPVIGQLSAGDSIAAIPQENGWLQITYDGAVAWIRPGSEGGGGLPAAAVNPPPAGQPTVIVEVSNLILRSQPTTASERITLLDKGTSLRVLAAEGDWYQVQTPGGQIGWVAGWLVNEVLSPAAASAQPTVTILNPQTNIRSGPSTESAVLARAEAGEVFPLVQTEGDWFQIRLPDGTLGYVASWIVKVDPMPGLSGEKPLQGKVIVVDPGHGGEDNGATGTSFSTLEKVINLQVAKLLKNKLEAAGATVILTRSDDRKVSLQERVDIAVRNKADLFVSIHHNSHPSSQTNGTIVFYYDQGESSKLASLVQTEIVKATQYKDLNARFGNYHVLRENPVVSILAEIAFLSNYEDERRLRTAEHQDQAAEGIYRGIVRYFQ
ncbi:SH3 domain-containing protein [Brevibacillus marinus]|uniref:SH3 domain-containing protein n=1 Tax=Brevibacillus marinus TaxID=2496837 RepID=UPI001F499143|nr:SH3 domain-containing protein [Brevibacillus marinus]